MRTVIVGQAPGPNSDPEVPLSGRCGEKLAALAGLPTDVFMRTFRRINLIDAFPGKNAKGDAFPLDAAREGILRALLAGRLDCDRVVLLGNSVARAFTMRPGDYPLLKIVPCGFAQHGMAVCPHPSGISRWWNEPRNVRRATRFWRMIARTESWPTSFS